MKKLFTLIIMALSLMMTSLAWGQTREEVVAYTLDGTVTGGSSGYATESEITQNDMTWMVTGNTTINPWRIGGKNLNEVDRPLYSTSAMSDNITKVVITNGTATATVNSMTLYVSSSADFSNPTTVAGSFTASATTTFEKPAADDWTNKYFKIVYNITAGSSNQYAQLVKAEFYKENGGQQSVATPTFSPAAGTYYEAQNVTIGTTTEGATIYYTLDGTDPTTGSTVYSAPIAISATTTVKAMAAKEGMNNSNVATATYTITTLTSLTTIPAIWEFATSVGTTATQASVTFNDWYVTGVKNSQVCVSDGQYGFVIYQSSHGFVAGDKLNGTVTCNVLLYQNHYAEITGVHAADLTVIAAQEVPVFTTTIGALEVRNYGTAINLDTLTYNNSKFYSAAGDSIVPYNNFNVNPNPLTSLEAGKQYIVKGVSIIYWQSSNATQQIAPRSAADFVEVVAPTPTVATPTFTPEAGTYTSAQNVTIACATEGTSIYYTIDGTDPTTASTAYTAAITISETTTVKAIAVKEGMNNSEVATALYTISAPATPTAYTLITNNVALVPGDKYIIVGVKSDTIIRALGKQNTNNRAAEEVTPVNNIITVTPATTNDGGVFELTLGQDTVGYWTLYDAVNGGYLYAAGTGNQNYLKTQETNDLKGEWTIQITNTGMAIIKAALSGTTRNWIRYNDYNNIFSCYGSGQCDVYLYKAGDIPQPTYYAVNVAAGIANGTVTVNPTTAAEGTTITVTATPASGYELATLTYTYGETTIAIDQTTMQFVMPAANVTVNATFTEMASVATPTFTPAEGTYTTTQYVTIACATEGATIYYTLDGTDPTVGSTVYADSITISATTTVKALAVKAGLNNSAIASATYTIVEPITIAAARALENNQYAMVQGVVTFIDGRNIYIQDTTAGIDLFLNSNTVPSALALGDMVKAYGKKTVYNGLIELSSINGGNANEFSILSNGNPLPVTVKTIAEILADAAGTNMLQSTRVQIVEAIIGAINTSNNTPITQGESTMNIYKIPVVEGLLEGDIVTVTGIIGCYNNPQLRVASAADVTFEHPVVQTVATPTFTPAAGTYYGPQNVTIACTTEGATIYYTLDGTDPTTASTVYTEPIAISATTTVKAFGVKEGLTDSEIATAVYTIEESTDWNRIYSAVDLNDGDKIIIASRYNDSIINGYYAMPAEVTGKPNGVLFYSITENNVERLPDSLANSANTYLWNVIRSGNIIKLVNSAGDTLGYNSSTNFSGNVNTEWYLDNATAGATSLVPNYCGFTLINTEITNRAVAHRNTEQYKCFGAYSTSNMTNASAGDYNFYLDFFVQGGSSTMAVATPTFSMAAGTYFNEIDVEIMCTTEEATIYYTLDGTDPTTSSSVYTGSIHIAETKTLKAMGVKEGFTNSSIASAEYIIEAAPSIITIAAAKLLELNEYAMVQGVVTFIDGRNIYIQDETAGIVLYLNANTVPETLVQGDMVVAYGKRSAYNGLIELSDINGNDPDKFNIISSGHTLPLATVTIAEILADYAGDNMLQSTRVEIVEATIGVINTNNNTPITQDGSTMNIYKMPAVEGLEEGDIVTFAGVIGCYNNPQMRIASADDIVFYHPGGDPTLTVTPNALSGFTYVVGHGPSAAQTFTVSGENLPPAPGGTGGGVRITCSNSHYEFSLDGEEYWHPLTIQVVGNLEPTTVYVRLEAGLPVGQWDGVITLEDGGLEVSVTVSGSVTPNTGIDEVLASCVSIWNNSNEMMIENNTDKALNVVVYNIVGQPVLSETIASGNNAIRHSLAEGVYIVRIADGKEMTSVKVVVRR